MPKITKQAWQRERYWSMQGRLTGAAMTLRHIATAAATLPGEASRLYASANTLLAIVQESKTEENRKLSFFHWRKRKEKEE